MDENKLKTLIQEEINNTVPLMIDNEISTHNHNGGGSQTLEGKNLSQAPQPALTGQSVSISSGGTNPLKSSDANSIINIATRVGEIEARLRALGLIN